MSQEEFGEELDTDFIEPKSTKVPDDTIKSNENDNVVDGDFSILSIVVSFCQGVRTNGEQH